MGRLEPTSKFSFRMGQHTLILPENPKIEVKMTLQTKREAMQLTGPPEMSDKKHFITSIYTSRQTKHIF